jgi:hypothetical protein
LLPGEAEVAVRRILGVLSYGLALLVAVACVLLGVQMTGHTAVWQQVVLIALGVAIAVSLFDLGRRLRRRSLEG